MNQAKALEKNNLEHILSPINTTGTLVPWIKVLEDGSSSEFKLVGHDGREYFVMSTSNVKESLPQYAWKEVKVIGVLNQSNRNLFPQKIFPKNSNDETNNIINWEITKRRNLIKNVAKKVNELVIIPIAVLAVLAS